MSTPLRQQANETAQSALRAASEYAIRHGHRNALLDARYEAAERVVDAVEEYEELTALADPGYADEWRTAVLSASYAEPDVLPDIPLADAGDHHVFPAGVGR